MFVLPIVLVVVPIGLVSMFFLLGMIRRLRTTEKDDFLLKE
jgi:hypothetical protein